MLVGNKSDLRPEMRQVTLADGQKLAQELGCAFVETTAKYNDNVAKAFEGMITEIEKAQEVKSSGSGSKCLVM